jgi:tetratricopeptide (TPR) repeat protein
MFTEDYILRMINQAMAVLLYMLRLKQAGQYQQALEASDTALETLLGLRASLLKQLDDEKMLGMLTTGDELDVQRTALLARIFKEEGEILAEEGRPDEARQAWQRALRFYLEAVLNDPSLLNAEQIAIIAGLRGKLEGASLPLATRMATLDYLEALHLQPPQRLAAAGVQAEALEQEIRALQAEIEQEAGWEG